MTLAEEIQVKTPEARFGEADVQRGSIPIKRETEQLGKRLRGRPEVPDVS